MIEIKKTFVDDLSQKLPSHLTVVGENRRDTGQILASHFTPVGRQWSAYEFERVISQVIPDEEKHEEKQFCQFCSSFVLAHDLSEATNHQPGYNALYISARCCAFCKLLWISLNTAISDQLEKKHSHGEVEHEPRVDLKQGDDETAIIPLSRSPNLPLVRRFAFVWFGIGFYWVTEVLGFYDFARESVIPAIWSSTETQDFEARFKVLEDWIQNCIELHRPCSLVEPPVLPSRVLDVRPSQGDSFVRVLTSRGARGKYAALSYCWGKTQPLKTNSTNIVAHECQIQLSSLGKTITDAIEICRYLQIPFLWVDALCIIQDDRDDWIRESSRMSDIYHNAFVCLAATSSEDSQGGLMHPFTASFHGTYGDDDEKCALRHAEVHSWQHPRPLEDRAWTLQEDLLSRRIIYFGAKQLQWKCKCLTASEDGLLDGLEDEETTLTALAREIVRLEYIDSKAIYRVWKNLAAEYSRRKLTISDDKLPALAGITQLFRHLLADEPLLGLWRNDLVSGLTWEPKGDSRRQLQQFPSWSWLSIDGDIEYDELWTRTDPNRDEYYFQPTLTICDAQINWTTIPLTSMVQSSTLVVRGYILEASPVEVEGLTSVDVMIGNVKLGYGSIDGGIELPQKLWCLHLGDLLGSEERDRGSNHGQRVVLFLKLLSGERETFERIGLGHLDPSKETSPSEAPSFGCQFIQSQLTTLTLR